VIKGSQPYQEAGCLSKQCHTVESGLYLRRVEWESAGELQVQKPHSTLVQRICWALELKVAGSTMVSDHDEFKRHIDRLHTTALTSTRQKVESSSQG
jgi:hypothetical protein